MEKLVIGRILAKFGYYDLSESLFLRKRIVGTARVSKLGGSWINRYIARPRVSC